MQTDNAGNKSWGKITNNLVNSNIIDISKINSMVVTDDYKIL